VSRITFRVSGIPKAQPRPRAFARNIGGKAVARVYESGTAEGWKSQIAIASREHTPVVPIEGPVIVDVTFFMPRPKRLCRKSDPDGWVPCTSKPDRDNLDKAVLDCMTQLGWWRDDAQVYAGKVEKFYHEKNGSPGATITVIWNNNGKDE
jgi:Holliday junction resolvase RusA-like endonuclease